MANRKNTFLLKRSNIAGKVPAAGDLLLGELALNISDVILYASGTTTNSILPIGWDRVARTGDTVTGDFNFFGDVKISGSSLPNGYALSVTGDTNFIGDVYVTGDLTYNGDLLVTGGTVIQSGLTANTIYTDYIDFNTNYTGATLPAGRLQWDDGNGTLVLGLKGGVSDIEIGLENMALCYNSEATTLTAGTVVYVSGSQGNRPSIKRAIATSDGYSVTTLGVVSEPIASGVEGFVTTFGMVNNLNTIGYSGGTPIWISPTDAGGYTDVKPKAPYHTVLIGYVVRVHASVGSIFVHVSNGWEIDELHDVRLNGRTEGDLLMLSGYNGSNVWVNSKTLNGSYTITGDTTVGGQMKATTVSATTYSNLPIDIRVTGGTYSSGTATFTNNTGGTFSVTGFSTGGGSTFTGGTVTGTTVFTSGLSANTISATTYYNLPTDIRVTGTTYSNNTFTYTNNTGGTFDVLFNTMTGLTVTGDLIVSGNTQSWFSGNSASDLVRITQTGSGNALVIEDSNNPDSTPFVVNTSGFVGIGISSPTNPLHISGSTDQIRLSNGSSVWTVASKSNNDFALVAAGGRASMYFGSYGATNSLRIGPTGAIIVNSSNDSQFTGVGNVIINNGLSANTISATTYQNLPTDIRVTGGTYSSGTTTFTNNTGGTFTVTGFSTSVSPISVVNTSSLFSTGLVSTGLNASGVTHSIFFGRFAGRDATSASNSNFLGNQAGYGATNAYQSIFIGASAGVSAINSNDSNFFGASAGDSVTNANNSNFFGLQAGSAASDANNSNFFGQNSGYQATGADNSNFMGQNSGNNASGASYSTLLGYNTGYASLISNSIGSNNIIIGTNISFSANTANAINIGGVLFGTGTYSVTTGNPIISASTGGRIGIGIVNPLATLHVSGDTLIQGNLTVTGNTQSLFSGNSSVELIKIIQNGSGDAFVVQDIANGDASHFVINASGNTAIGLTQPLGTDKLTVSGNTTIYGTLSATTYAGLPNAGVLVVPIATSSVAVGTGSNDYYLNFKIPYNLTISKVDFSVSIAGSDSVRIGIYRGQDLTAVLVGQSSGGTVSTLNSVPIVAESGQNLTFSGGSWIVIGVAVGGTTTNLYGSACPANNLIAWTNTTDSSGGFPTNPRSKGGTRTSFPSIEITLA